ncbi:hypothetical protein [Bradyrhizobium sp.]|uniref:hypothetical protein n=1 Tax=Bradyrhizobium sp. TaxID=376 RepID=UPI00262084AF|nr:hypothetical protein [Bradyrhizobium sp.]
MRPRSGRPHAFPGHQSGVERKSGIDARRAAVTLSVVRYDAALALRIPSVARIV